MILRFYSFVLSLLFLSLSLKAQVKLARVFTNHMVLQQQADVKLWGWTKPNEKLSIYSSWDNKQQTIKANSKGEWWVQLQTPKASFTEQEIKVKSTSGNIKLQHILIGEVWLCGGQSNMEMPMKGFKSQPVWGANAAVLKSANPNIRVYTVPRGSQLLPQDTSKTSFWKVAQPESIANFSATGYYFGRLLQEMLQVPIGLINCSYGGSVAEAWMSKQALQDFKDINIPQRQDSIKSPNRTATLLYNAMLKPIIPYAIKGCIWYQGESNYERPDQYESLFPAMVKHWRSEWKQGDFPFYYAQIAPYNYAQLPPYHYGGKYNSAYIRDAQRKAEAKISNSAMAVLLDIGEENNIHPMHKEPVGTRLALLALAQTYGLKGFGYASPAVESTQISGSVITVKFKNAPNGLTSYGKELQQFEVAGANKQYYPAKASIQGSTVVVSSPMVKEPVAVRYAFKDFVVGELFSTEGLPLSSFRTDDF
ncbi:sialate O-acetylesterase [Pedobacter puniceum]|uniref:Sialate O-acetylesterase n=1 Tax=Pedobacter puniceum TaxID=2666136 RepID=A0A7K0FKC1_9SPHI|nr:sialate O-acetylesterase [Pedobacter puniceum]MRX46222.1 sialate O-acetylesterase [Pedobacter puniceum]